MKSAYHISPILHPVGTILKGNGRPKVEPTIEEALERFRPEPYVSRLNSVYSRETTDFSMLGLDSGYTYRVTIRWDCQRHDARWIGLLQQAYLKPKVVKTYLLVVQHWPDWTGDFVEAVSAKYWAGVASGEPLWELLSTEAEVEAQLSNTPVNATATKGGDAFLLRR